MILYDAFIVHEKVNVKLTNEEMRRKKEMNMEMSKKVNEVLFSINDRNSKLENECFINAIEKGY